MAMHQSIEAILPATPQRVFDVLSSLDTYPTWLDLVAAVEPATPVPGDPDLAWWVTLRAKVGPFARSKRLRMVRTVADAPSHLRFERREVDGREHSAWILEVFTAAGPTDEACNLEVSLRYEGGLWSSPLEAVLGAQVEAAVPQLASLVR